MVKKFIFCISIIGMNGLLIAADQRRLRLNKSVPTHTSTSAVFEDLESMNKACEELSDKVNARNSAPGRLSDERSRHDERSVSLDITTEPRKKALSDSPVMRSRFISKSNSAKKPFIIAADMFDAVVSQSIDENRKKIEEVASKASLKTSNFYRIVQVMRSESMLASTDVVALANYFLYSVMSKDCFKNYMKGAANYIPAQPACFGECVDSIKVYLDAVTHNAIAWPLISREENPELYYKELLEKNKDIHVTDVVNFYLGSVLAIFFLSQGRDRALNLKQALQKLIESPKRIRKGRKGLIAELEHRGIFAPSFNVSFDVTVKASESGD